MRSKNPELMKKMCDFIDEYFVTYHAAPTQREIAKAVNVTQPCVHKYLIEMRERGLIDFDRKITGTKELSKCDSDYVSVPIVGSIRCGDPMEEREGIESYVSLPTSVFGKGPFYILKAKGDSMVDAGIQEGDLVVIRQQNTAEIGDIVVALDDEQQNTLKRLDGFDSETHEAILSYENEKQYPEWKIRVRELVVQGVAKHVIHQL